MCETVASQSIKMEFSTLVVTYWHILVCYHEEKKRWRGRERTFSYFWSYVSSHSDILFLESVVDSSKHDRCHQCWCYAWDTLVLCRYFLWLQSIAFYISCTWILFSFSCSNVLRYGSNSPPLTCGSGQYGNAFHSLCIVLFRILLLMHCCIFFLWWVIR